MDILVEAANLQTQIDSLYNQFQSKSNLSLLERFQVEQNIKELSLKLSLINMQLDVLRSEKNAKALSS